MATAITTPSTPATTIDSTQALLALKAINVDGRRIIFRTIFAIIVAYTLAAMLHFFGQGWINIILGVIVMAVAVAYGFQPINLAAVTIGGTIYAAIDPTITAAPAVRQGLEALGRIVNSVVLFTGLMFGFFGTWPIQIYPTGYLAIGPAIVLFVSLMIYTKIQIGRWLWRIGGTYIILLIVLSLLGMPLIPSRVSVPDVATELGEVNLPWGNGSPQFALPDRARPLGNLEPILIASGEVSREIIPYINSLICWQPLPAGIIVEVKRPDGVWVERNPPLDFMVKAYRFVNNGSQPAEISLYRVEAGC